jgi:two-component system response regulator AlgR
MKCLVVDDELLARQRLSRLLERCDCVEICGEASNGREAVELAQRIKPDAVLLDIRMPGMDGLEAARHLVSLAQAPAVIFTTAYGDHALEAFEAQAIDYLLKPVSEERLVQALLKARRLSRIQLQELEAANDRTVRTHLCARVHGNLVLVPIGDVIYLQADQKYVTVRSAAGEILIEESLKALEQEFGNRFLRIHRNALVAKSALQKLEKNADGQCFARFGAIDDRLEVSRRLLPSVRRYLKTGRS